ncbi:hypothetical protein L0663_17460 [Dyadobacter sp. CY107]|uniref:hypothetical protein n=1 Tax=Dyadobacter fanqingshengii TaxID=2906443 RepID=UPI001F29BC76|nr:hypothetical protein [Dyadobacter fanqingshengii]MCF2505187.1 hypothetical protein [Dyadobacter fanqingshengii]
MKKLLLLTGMLTLIIHSYAYDSRFALSDTIPDTTKIQPATGSKASVVSIGTGLGSVGFGVFSFAQMVNGNFEDVPVVFGLVGAIGIVAIISGIVGLSNNHKMKQTPRTKTELEEMKKTKRRSIGGIILGVIGIIFSILLIQMDYGNFGW